MLTLEAPTQCKPTLKGRPWRAETALRAKRAPGRVTYDNVNRLVSMANKINGGANISTFGYSYDAVGNRLTKTMISGTETYGYDNLNQLTSAQYPTGSPFANTGFNYDPLGNRTTVTNGAATTYTANNLNQYTQVNTNTLNYDPNGNLTSYNGFNFSYDYENRLIGATNGTTTASYGFDPFGRRISKIVNGTITNFVYDGDDLLAEYDSSGNLQKKYIYGQGVDEPIAMISGANTFYYNRDGLGSISELTDNTGTVVENYSYDVYGKTIIKDGNGNILTQSAIGNRFMFTGRELDSESGLYYYRARIYSPDLGRFLQTDPLHFDDENPYSYCGNNAINWIDPYGKQSITEKLTLITIVIAVGKLAIDYTVKAAQNLNQAVEQSTGKCIIGHAKDFINTVVAVSTLGPTMILQAAKEKTKEDGKTVTKHPDGTSTEVEPTRNDIGADGGISTIRKEKDASGNTVEVWHEVHVKGKLVHKDWHGPGNPPDNPVDR